MSDAKHLPATPPIEGSGGPLSFSLEVRGGLTGFRRRPILGDRFLIGSDPVCDLRLDGRLAAPLHCLLRRDGTRLEAERLCDLPMAVNGVAVDHAELNAGDSLSVGSVRLIVHAHQVRFDVVRASDDLIASCGSASPTASSKAACRRSAAELIELIEAENGRVEEFESRRRAGAAALLDAISRRSRRAPEATAAVSSAASFVELVTGLDRLSKVIEQQASQPLVGERDVKRAAAELMAAQQELLAQADRLLQLASQFAAASGATGHRAA